MGIYFHRGPIEEPGRGLVCGGLSETDEENSRNRVFLSEKVHCRGSLGRVPLLGTLEDMLRKAPNTGISLHRGPFTSEGNLESGGGLVYRGLSMMTAGGL